MRESHIRHLKLQSPAAAVTTNSHQQTLQQSHRSHFIVNRLCCTYAGVFPRRSSPMMSLTHQCGQISHMHTFLPARGQHSTLIQRKPLFSLLLSPLQALPKPPADLQGTSKIRRSRTTPPLSG